MDNQQPFEPPPAETYTPPAAPPPVYAQAPPAADGLSDTAAGAIAYLSFVPAIIFLLVEPYKSRKFVRFHSIQCLMLSGVSIAAQVLHVIPILGTIAALVIGLAVVVFWFIAIINAAQGKMYEIPLIGPYAMQYANSMV